MRILLNALAATSLAGRHVVEGLVHHLAHSAPRGCHWLIVAPSTTFSHLAARYPNVAVHEGPSQSVHWMARGVWEVMRIPAIATGWGADFVVAYSGIRVPGMRVPQVCMACNPRPLIRVPFFEAEQGLKHPLQRRLYRWSSEGAACTIFNSEHLRELYSDGGQRPDSCSVVVHHGIGDDVFQAIRCRPPAKRERYHIVSASVWSPYKGAETIVDAVAELRSRSGLPVTLTLAGPWPKDGYRRRVMRRINRRGIGPVVQITGMVSREKLFDFYEKARLFCLPSYSESFGIPAVEAQAFGTPVIGSNTTAMEEICGDGGLYCEPGRTDQLAHRLYEVLVDSQRWEQLSVSARENAKRFSWSRCATTLNELLEDAMPRHANRSVHAQDVGTW